MWVRWQEECEEEDRDKVKVQETRMSSMYNV